MAFLLMAWGTEGRGKLVFGGGGVSGASDSLCTSLLYIGKRSAEDVQAVR